MDQDHLKRLLEEVRTRKVGVSDAMARLRILPFEELEFASVDHHRFIRQGFPEVIFCEGKTRAQVVAIAKGLLKQGGPLLATRVESEVARGLCRLDTTAIYNQPARTVVIPRGGGISRGMFFLSAQGRQIFLSLKKLA